MSALNRVLTIALAGFLLAGCDDKKNPPMPRVEDKPKAPAVDESSKPAAPVKLGAIDLPKPAIDPVIKPNDAPATPTPREQATKLLTDLKSAIDRGKFSQADQSLKKLDAMKETLPPDLSKQLEVLRTAYNSWPGNGPNK